MATQFGSSFNKGHSINRPSLFNRVNYTYQKAMMKIFIQDLDYNLWSIIINGPHISTPL